MGESAMPHLTLQEVIDRIRKNYPSKKEELATKERQENASHRPEFYIPRITRLFASLLLGA
jgi:hypothetical protein